MSVQSIHAFAEKVSLVADASLPEARAAAMQLALQGSFVIAGFSKVTPHTESFMEELRALGTLAASVPIDGAGTDSVSAVITEAENRFGRIDLLVNCLKSGPHSSFDETTEQSFENSICAGLGVRLSLIRQALPLMTPRPSPRIVNIVYSADSSDVIGRAVAAAEREMARSLAEYLPKHFRVNTVEIVPGDPAETHDFDPELIAPRTGVSADDAARAVLYLLSPEARALNGQILSVS